MCWKSTTKRCAKEAPPKNVLEKHHQKMCWKSTTKRCAINVSGRPNLATLPLSADGRGEGGPPLQLAGLHKVEWESLNVDCRGEGGASRRLAGLHQVVQGEVHTYGLVRFIRLRKYICHNFIITFDISSNIITVMLFTTTVTVFSYLR